MANEELLTVFVGFMPVFIFLILIFIIFYFEISFMELVYLLPIVLAGIFYSTWYFQIFSLISEMNGAMLTVLNVIVSFVFAAVLSVVHPHGVNKIDGGLGLNLETPDAILRDSNKEISFEKTHAKQVLPTPLMPDKPMSVTIRGIEDKCKAINFVIGRVYSAKRGGSKEIREKIAIPKELYNAFSELVQEEDIVNPKKLLEIVEKISKRLVQLDTKESKLFVLKKAKIVVDRSEDGSDTVISVLSRNDKDPIEEYHSEALEICSQVINYLKQLG
jgi:hypothetical protein